MQKALLSTVVLSSFLAAGLMAQTPGDTLWTRTYGGINDDKGWCVRQTSDDGYIISGWTDSFGEGSYDIYLIRTNESGDTLWTKMYGDTGSDDGRCVRQTPDGGFVIVGNTQPIGIMGSYVWLIKTDSSGDTLWTRSWGETPIPHINTGRCVQQTSDGGYIISGHAQFLGTNDEDVYLIKTDANGNTEWSDFYGGTAYEIGYWTQQTSDGGYIVVGYTTSFGNGNEDVYLVRTNASGDTLWTRTYGGTGTDSGYSVQQTSDGGYIIAGFTDSFGAGSYDVYLIKTDALGDTLWTRTYGGTNFDKGYSVQQIIDGTYLISGVTKSFGAGNGDFYLIRTDMLGDTLWTRTYGGANEERGWSVQQTSDNGYIIGGYRGAFGDNDVYLVKTGPDSSCMLLSGNVEADQLVLTWNPLPSAMAYWVYGASNEAFFTPGFFPEYDHRIEILGPETTLWSSGNGVGNATSNWAYLILAVDESEQELARSNRISEFDFQEDIP